MRPSRPPHARLRRAAGPAAPGLLAGIRGPSDLARPQRASGTREVGLVTNQITLTKAASAPLTDATVRLIAAGDAGHAVRRDRAAKTVRKHGGAPRHAASRGSRTWLGDLAAASWRHCAGSRLARAVVAGLAGVAIVVLVKFAAAAHILIRLADVGANVNAAGAASAGAAAAGAAGAASSGPGGGGGGAGSGGAEGSGGAGSSDGQGGSGGEGTSGGIWHTVIDTAYNAISYIAGEGVSIFEAVTTGMEAVAAGAQGKYEIQQSGGLSGGTTNTGQFVSQHPGCDPNFPEQC